MAQCVTISNINPRSPLLPAAINTFRKNRPYPTRLTGLPLNILRNPYRQDLRNSVKAGIVFGPTNLFSDAIAANLFHGQIAKQSSHPKIRFPIALRNSRGICPYAQWSDKKCTVAHQADMEQQTHLSGIYPNSWCSLHNGQTSGVSMGKSASVKMVPRNSQEPAFRDTRLVCFPCQPAPACAANGFSINGAVSTNTFTLASGTGGKLAGQLF